NSAIGALDPKPTWIVSIRSWILCCALPALGCSKRRPVTTQANAELRIADSAKVFPPDRIHTDSGDNRGSRCHTFPERPYRDRRQRCWPWWPTMRARRRILRPGLLGRRYAARPPTLRPLP